MANMDIDKSSISSTVKLVSLFDLVVLGLTAISKSSSHVLVLPPIPCMLTNPNSSFDFFMPLRHSKQVSKEGDTFEVPLEVAHMSELIKGMMDTDDEDDGSNNGVTTGTVIEMPLPNVKSDVLEKVISFCEHHLKEPMAEIEKPLKSPCMADIVQRWYSDFVGESTKHQDQEMLFELLLAANYMDVKPLLDLTCATVASMIKGKTVSSRCSKRTVRTSIMLRVRSVSNDSPNSPAYK